MNPIIPTYKIVLVGDGGVGKSAFLKRLMTDEFEQKYIATLGVEVHPCRSPRFVFDFWDCAGQEKFGGLKDGYYIGAQAVIFMFDLSSKITFKSLKKWIVDVKRVTGPIPYLLVGTKSDLPRFIYKERIRKTLENSNFIEVSSKTGEGFSKVYESLFALFHTPLDLDT